MAGSHQTNDLKFSIFEQSENCQKIVINIVLNASFSVKNAPKSLAAGVLSQTPLGELTALPQTSLLWWAWIEIWWHPWFQPPLPMNAEYMPDTWPSQKLKFLNKCLRDWKMSRFRRKLACFDCLCHFTYKFWASKFSKLSFNLFRMDFVQLEKILKISPDSMTNISKASRKMIYLGYFKPGCTSNVV